ncbi:nickel pincer cofactor biosynthesis protein LarB [Fontibacillus panacisegetis]
MDNLIKILKLSENEVEAREALQNYINNLNDNQKNNNNIEDLGYAQLDLDRQRRTGFPEVIYSEGKTTRQLKQIFKKLSEKNDRVLATRVSKKTALQVISEIPLAVYNESARTLAWSLNPIKKKDNKYITIVCAGTSDLPVANEALVTAEMMGCNVRLISDVGVAGIHRLFKHIEIIRSSDVIIIVAGMEGALASVIGGLVSKPIIAVPTSVGYGSSFNGVASLLAMLNSCSAGITVVNIDNGFGAGFAAGLIINNQ